MNSFTIHSVAELKNVAKSLLKTKANDKIFAFYGEMGAGKTTFIKAVCEELKVERIVTSPTFSIVNEYQIQDGNRVFHFDFYRIENAQEAIQIGYFEYIESGYFCLMEWPEKIENLLPDNCVYVSIKSDHQSGSRTISWP